MSYQDNRQVWDSLEGLRSVVRRQGREIAELTKTVATLQTAMAEWMAARVGELETRMDDAEAALGDLTPVPNPRGYWVADEAEPPEWIADDEPEPYDADLLPGQLRRFVAVEGGNNGHHE